jgi:hypothetical protein
MERLKNDNRSISVKRKIVKKNFGKTEIDA